MIEYICIGISNNICNLIIDGTTCTRLIPEDSLVRLIKRGVIKVKNIEIDNNCKVSLLETNEMISNKSCSQVLESIIYIT